MKILYVAPCLPYPPDKGERIRAFHQLDFLARAHEIHLACLIDERTSTEHVESLRRAFASVEVVRRDIRIARLKAALGAFLGKPLSRAAFHSRRLEKAILRKLRSEKIDCVLVFSAAMAQHVRDVSHVPRVIDFVDVQSGLWDLAADRRRAPFSWFCRLEAQRWARYEAETSREFDASIVVSTAESELFRRRVADRPVSVVPNGVDLDHFAAPPSGPARSGVPMAVFTGSMDYEPNVDAVEYFCREILPLIRCRSPGLEFMIVGRDPIRPVRRLAREPGVIVTGAVRDVRPYLAVATVMVVPFRLGRGIQNKVLEAMAFGVPVVGTTHAFLGLESPEEAGVRMADEPKRFAQEVLALLEDPERHRLCRVKARRYVERHHRWDDHNAKLSRILLRCTKEAA